MRADILCFSRSRWAGVPARSYHVMVRFARSRRVFFVEEPHWVDGPSTATVTLVDGVFVVIPWIGRDVPSERLANVHRQLLDAVVTGYGIDRPIAWFQTPMAMPLIAGLPVQAVVYDCVDEMTGVAGATTDLRAREAALLDRADVVFTGGYSLYDAKRHLHPNVHPMPDSVDVPHFAGGRRRPVPLDQHRIARPRLGFAGVIDERINLGLVQAIAARRPDCQIVLLNPVSAIDPRTLPQAPNIHYLGMKSYREVPDYLAGWDVALMPFAHNDTTHFLCPAETLEYLAAGIPVVSTSIRDIVRPYGEEGYVQIADTVDDFVKAIAVAMTPGGRAGVRRAQALLATMSWDRTFEDICDVLEAVLAKPVKMPLVRALGAQPAPAAAS